MEGRPTARSARLPVAIILDCLIKLIYIAGQRRQESWHRLRCYTSRRTRRVMKLPSKFTALVCCIVLLVLAGAGTSLWGQTAGFAYVANCGSSNCASIGSGNVSAYTIDGTTGALTPVAGSPFAAESGPTSVAVHPTGQFAYVGNFGSRNVSAYSIDGITGALTPVAGSPFPAGSYPHSVTVDPRGQFAYVANGYSSTDVSAYTIDGTTGALTPVAGSPFPAGSYPSALTVAATGQFAYVANPYSNNCSAFTIH